MMMEIDAAGIAGSGLSAHQPIWNQSSSGSHQHAAKQMAARDVAKSFGLIVM